MTKTIKAAATDELILTSLRPMSELCRTDPVLLYDNFYIPIMGVFFSVDCIVTEHGNFHSDRFIGWRDVPKFRPEWMDLSDAQVEYGKEMAKAISDYEESQREETKA